MKFITNLMMRTKTPFSIDPGLHLIATPIGNLNDISVRALGTLEQVDLIVCEDTRVTNRLLNHYGLQKVLWAYHDHNAAAMRPKILSRLSEGAKIALVSDAGTPTMADPGYKLVEETIEAGIKVSAVPGAMAGIMALSISGLPTDKFFFGGFLPPKAAARQRQLQVYQSLPATLVFYESPRRLQEMLQDCLSVLGNRRAAICRELTKVYEEVRRASLSELQNYYSENPEIKGEIVVVIEGPTLEPPTEEILRAALEKAKTQGLDRRTAIEYVMHTYAASKRQVYNLALIIYAQK